MQKEESNYSKVIEQYGPLVSSLIVMVIVGVLSFKNCYCNEGKLILCDSFDKILDSVIVFASIIVGFIGVLMGILFSISDKELIKIFLDTRAKGDLKKYFSENIISGLLLVILSIILYLDDSFNPYILCALVSVWFFLLVFVFISTYRLINIMMYVLFSCNEKNGNVEPKGMHMDKKMSEEFEKKYSKKQL